MTDDFIFLPQDSENLTLNIEWKDSTITIQTKTGPKQVPAKVSGGLAVHRVEDSEAVGFTITHIRSGMNLINSGYYPKEEDTLQLCGDILKYSKVNWALSKDKLIKKHPDAGGIVGAFMRGDVLMMSVHPKEQMN